MTNLERWHEVVAGKDPDLLDPLLADDCVFHSPIVHTPQEGKALTKLYLAAAMQVLTVEGFAYTKEIVDGNQMVLEFSVENEGVMINGVDIISFNNAGQIVEFKVMVRPLKAVNFLHAQMKAMLESMTAAS
ncbi:nuclear transport factor 2 family protein [Halieaceae bacterium IMCC14734]|uniref:Nuclear transport factor 2 family protein n=1 Tax=Candidatus Litorirhabdus singularis TaxID=2518993 RepID=A0ABT3TFS0_9GAMM|nr:nuclear transport factor 2 family protein [Candidatus Litorirhabdus singularis]MCX2980264.1 nuclear transport factor 2 family protein [Candidatus Litorirhabdus singularis]